MPSNSQTPFEWLPAEYDGLLEQISSTDLVDAEWSRLREIIKHKLDKNIQLFLNQEFEKPAPVPPRGLSALSAAGIKLPPFPTRPNRGDSKKYIDPPKSVITGAEASEYKESIYAQLNEFDGAPFTIQRVCELCLHPTKHYRTLAKYLRAVEKSLLVTSTWDSFPLPIGGEGQNNCGVVTSESLAHFSSAPATPRFSPIPFLHDDARSRSQSPMHSRSPSRSASPPMRMGPVEHPNVTVPTGTEERAIGLVDELDDPSPGHLSDHLHPLSATTTTPSRPVASLADRFVTASDSQSQDKAGDSGPESGAEAPPAVPDATAVAVEIVETQPSNASDDMVVDDPEKENKAD